jgi:membrane protease subunit (stomatin/prohibitin family)
MAIQKSPDTKKEVIPEETKTKGKRKHRPTACVDKRRAYSTCGICGSQNLATHGVAYCKICGKEEMFLVLDYGYYFFGRDEDIKYPKCNCERKSKWDLKYDRISVTECLDCGAVRGPKCPACGKQLWAKGEKRFCKSCGYRI